MSSIKTKNLTPLYAFIQGLYWMNFAAIMGYSGFYLLGSGFSNTEHACDEVKWEFAYS